MARENEATCESAPACDRDSCEGCPVAPGEGQESFLVEQNQFSNINHVIGIVSGKGGVGKSMVTASIANQLRDNGYKVGILDADITGPSIPRMYGLDGYAEADGEMIIPRETENGIKVISINLLMANPEDPVVWRGPILASVIKQFWQDVIWGDLDFLLVDMPPGTGDIPLTVFQSLPVEGIFIVTSPQDLVKMIVKKAFNMAQMMNIPVLGLIENYSYMVCPDCGKQIQVFGESKIEEVASEMGVLIAGKVPIDPELARLCDEGGFERAKNPYVSKAIDVLKILCVKDEAKN